MFYSTSDIFVKFASSRLQQFHIKMRMPQRFKPNPSMENVLETKMDALGEPEVKGKAEA